MHVFVEKKRRKIVVVPLTNKRLSGFSPCVCMVRQRFSGRVVLDTDKFSNRFVIYKVYIFLLKSGIAIIGKYATSQI